MTQLDGRRPSTDFDRTTAVVPGRRASRRVRRSSSTPGGRRWSACTAATCARSRCGAPRRWRRAASVRTHVDELPAHRARSGPATLSVREVREGRSITTMVADLVQDGRLLITSRLTLMTERSGRRVERAAGRSICRRRRTASGCDAGACGRTSTGSTGCIDPRSMPFSGGDRAHGRRLRASARGPPGRRARGWRWRPTGSRRPRSCGSSRRPAA